MSRTRRLTQTERAEIIREAGEGVGGTSELAERFGGVTPRAIQYTLKADEDRQKDAAVATAAVTVKLTPPEELSALDEVLAAAGGIETRTEGGVRRLIQAAGGEPSFRTRSWRLRWHVTGPPCTRSVTASYRSPSR